jgi:hypothetical protein
LRVSFAKRLRGIQAAKTGPYDHDARYLLIRHHLIRRFLIRYLAYWLL